MKVKIGEMVRIDSPNSYFNGQTGKVVVIDEEAGEEVYTIELPPNDEWPFDTVDMFADEIVPVTEQANWSKEGF